MLYGCQCSRDILIIGSIICFISGLYRKKPSLVLLERENIALNFLFTFKETFQYYRDRWIRKVSRIFPVKYWQRIISLHEEQLKLYNTFNVWYFPSEISEINLELTLLLSTKSIAPPFSSIHAFRLFFFWMDEYFSLIKNTQFAKIVIALLLKQKGGCFFSFG